MTLQIADRTKRCVFRARSGVSGMTHDDTGRAFGTRVGASDRASEGKYVTYESQIAGSHRHGILQLLFLVSNGRITGPWRWAGLFTRARKRNIATRRWHHYVISEQ